MNQGRTIGKSSNGSIINISPTTQNHRKRWIFPASAISATWVSCILLISQTHSPTVGAFATSQKTNIQRVQNSIALSNHSDGSVERQLPSTRKERLKGLKSKVSLFWKAPREWTWTRAARTRTRKTDRTEPPMSPTKEQFVVDKYLESIERRYKRVHYQNRDKELSNRTAFTNAWSWLTNSAASTREDKTDDALFVLGIADLASERMLQKHGLPTLRQSSCKPIEHMVSNEEERKTLQTSG